MSRSRKGSCSLVVAALWMLSACSGSTGGDQGQCEPADETVVSEIMSKARTNFQDGGSVTERFELVKAATGPIPESKQRFGASRLMALLVSVYVKDPDVPGDLQGVQGPVYVVLDDDGRPLGPLGTFSQPFFDIKPPADPGWTAWADGIDDTDVAYDVVRCLKKS